MLLLLLLQAVRVELFGGGVISTPHGALIGVAGHAEDLIVAPHARRPAKGKRSPALFRCYAAAAEWPFGLARVPRVWCAVGGRRERR